MYVNDRSKSNLNAMLRLRGQSTCYSASVGISRLGDNNMRGKGLLRQLDRILQGRGAMFHERIRSASKGQGPGPPSIHSRPPKPLNPPQQLPRHDSFKDANSRASTFAPASSGELLRAMLIPIFQMVRCRSSLIPSDSSCL